MLSVRWRKLARDLSTQRGRVLLMLTAIAVSLVGLGTMLGAYSILTREIAASYLGTRPATATLELPEGVDRALVEQVRQHPLVAEAEAREVILARGRVADDDWRRLLLFVVDDFSDLRLNRFVGESGEWPPSQGSMLIERSSGVVLDAGSGGTFTVKTPHGEPRELAVLGVVHDPGLAPAWQEGAAYGYVTRETAVELGESPTLTELRVELEGAPTDLQVIEAQTAQLAQWLVDRGHPVHELRIPPPARHPHQSQMETVLAMMLVFCGMALVLSGILVATSLAAMLARQVREIGVMKTIGARAGQIAGIYLVFVGLLGLASVVVAIPVGVLGAQAFSKAIAQMLNFNLSSQAIPAWVFAVQLGAGVLTPLMVAAIPIGRSSRTTVRQALDNHGASTDQLRAWFARLPPVLRGALRRPGRLALTLGLMSAGGAMFMMALNVKRGWEANVAKVYETRSYDVEVVLQTPEPIAVAERLRGVPGVSEVEAWGRSPAAFARPDQIDVVRTYPDMGHGSLTVLAPPATTKLIDFPVLAGRWLAVGDRDAVVLNHAALAQAPEAEVGSEVELSIDGQKARFRVVGIVEEIGAAGVAYITDEAFAELTSTQGQARMLRIATDAESPADRVTAIRAVEQALADAGVGVESATPLAALRTAMGDHILILIRSLMAMAAIFAIVGALGLGSAMGVSVVERTRELGIMKTLGATPGHIVRLLAREGVAIGTLSFVPALLLSLPLTWYVDRLVGKLGFLASLPFEISTRAALAWFGGVVIVSFVATLVPARRASALRIREALARD